jgi:hypothetical protein
MTCSTSKRRDADKTLAGYGSYACVGVLANVSQPGRVVVGDEVRLGLPL